MSNVLDPEMLAAALPQLERRAGFRYAPVRSYVKRLQQELRRLSYPVAEDGLYGDVTASAVRHFQRAAGLEADGVVGYRTWRALFQAPNEDVAPESALGWYATTYSRAVLGAHVSRAEAYRAHIERSAARHGLAPCVLAGIGSRESGWGLFLTPQGPAGTGDNGHGRGLMQIDDRCHQGFTRSGDWRDPAKNIEYGAALLKSYIDRMPQLPSERARLRAGLAAYDGGPEDVIAALKAGACVDTETTSGDYSKDVLDRAGFFQTQGW